MSLGSVGPVADFNSESYTEATLPTAAVAALTLPLGYRVMCRDSGIERTLLSAGGVPYWLPTGGTVPIVVDTVLYVDSVNGSDVTGTGAQVSFGSATAPVGCTVRIREPTHLRANSDGSGTARVHPTGTLVRVTGAPTGTIDSSGSALYPVTVIASGAPGFMYLSDAEAGSCA